MTMRRALSVAGSGIGGVLALWALVALVEFFHGEPPVVYDRPIANCIEWADLVRNRPYPPKHGVHSYAKDVPICGR